MKTNKQMVNNYSEKATIPDDALYMQTNKILENYELNKNLTVNENKANNTSAVAKHLKEKKHVIDWKNTRVVWTDNEPHKLLIKESLVIKTYEPELNRTTHSVPLYIYPNGIEKRFLPKMKIYKENIQTYNILNKNTWK
jgi:hypothetical protein